MRSYWRRNQRIVLSLLAVWFLVSFVAVFFSGMLNEIVVLGFPLAYYFGAQGAVLTFVVLIILYARLMNRLDREFNVQEDEKK
jgi:putative solute:sodium symporter small subunit